MLKPKSFFYLPVSGLAQVFVVFVALFFSGYFLLLHLQSSGLSVVITALFFAAPAVKTCINMLKLARLRCSLLSSRQIIASITNRMVGPVGNRGYITMHANSTNWCHMHEAPAYGWDLNGLSPVYTLSTMPLACYCILWRLLREKTV